MVLGGFGFVPGSNCISGNLTQSKLMISLLERKGFKRSRSNPSESSRTSKIFESKLDIEGPVEARCIVSSRLDSEKHNFFAFSISVKRTGMVADVTEESDPHTYPIAAEALLGIGELTPIRRMLLFPYRNSLLPTESFVDNLLRISESIALAHTFMAGRHFKGPE